MPSEVITKAFPILEAKFEENYRSEHINRFGNLLEKPKILLTNEKENWHFNKSRRSFSSYYDSANIATLRTKELGSINPFKRVKL